MSTQQTLLDFTFDNANCTFPELLQHPTTHKLDMQAYSIHLFVHPAVWHHVKSLCNWGWV